MSSFASISAFVKHKMSVKMGPAIAGGGFVGIIVV